jgi:hypothetical protein
LLVDVNLLISSFRPALSEAVAKLIAQSEAPSEELVLQAVGER